MKKKGLIALTLLTTVLLLTGCCKCACENCNSQANPIDSDWIEQHKDELISELLDHMNKPGFIKNPTTKNDTDIE